MASDESVGSAIPSRGARRCRVSPSGRSPAPLPTDGLPNGCCRSPAGRVARSEDIRSSMLAATVRYSDRLHFGNEDQWSPWREQTQAKSLAVLRRVPCWIGLHQQSNTHAARQPIEAVAEGRSRNLGGTDVSADEHGPISQIPSSRHLSLPSAAMIAATSCLPRHRSAGASLPASTRGTALQYACDELIDSRPSAGWDRG